MKKWFAFVLTVALVLGCVTSALAEETQTIKIALINALSGDSAEGGQHELEAAQLAVKHINDAGGIQSLAAPSWNSSARTIPAARTIPRAWWSACSPAMTSLRAWVERLLA